MEFDRCREILLQEYELVVKIGGLQEKVYTAVVNRDWEGMEERFEALNAIGTELGILEKEREAIFCESLGGTAKKQSRSERFYAYAVRLSQMQRMEITGIYRGLKMETLKVKAMGDAISNYISSAKTTMAGFFETAFPSRAGKTYSPKGTRVSHDMRSMVLNQSF